MGDYIRLVIPADAQTFADDAILQLQNAWPTWTPNEGDMEVVQIETLAPMAANAAQVAAVMPESAFRAYGTKLIGLSYETGAPATGDVTVTFTDSLGYTVPAGSEIAIDGFTFTFDQDAVVNPGANIYTNAPVTAAENGTLYNDLVGVNVQPITSLAFIASLDLAGPTAGGVDQEDDTDYQDRLSRDLMLRARSIVTARDYVIVALDQPEVARALAENNGTRNVAITAIGWDGQPIPAAVKTRLNGIYQSYRLVNTTFTWVDPTYTTIAVTWNGRVYDGYDPAAVHDDVNAALTAWLNPLTYGLPLGTGNEDIPASWTPDPIVRVNKAIQVIEGTAGMDVLLAPPVLGGPTHDSAGNVTMAGTVPLPQPGAMTGTIT